MIDLTDDERAAVMDVLEREVGRCVWSAGDLRRYVGSNPRRGDEPDYGAQADRYERYAKLLESAAAKLTTPHSPTCHFCDEVAPYAIYPDGSGKRLDLCADHRTRLFPAQPTKLDAEAMWTLFDQVYDHLGRQWRHELEDVRAEFRSLLGIGPKTTDGDGSAG